MIRTQAAKKALAKRLGIDYNDIRYTEVLSQDEIDQLLTAINGPHDDADFNGVRMADEKNRNIRPADLDFRRASDYWQDDLLEEMKKNFETLQKQIDNINRDVDTLVDVIDRQTGEIEQLKADNIRLRKLQQDNDLFD